MASDLDRITTTVTVKGDPLTFAYMELSQSFNDHHSCIVTVNDLTPTNIWQQKPDKFIDYMGEELKITMQHAVSGAINEFIGIVTNVRMIGHDGEHSTLVIQGASPTILLDNNDTMNSFTDKTLDAIIKEAGKDYSAVSIDCNPKFKEMIPYLAQYKESVFEFLNRLSAIYHEWFFYNGKKVFFGKPNSINSEPIVYDKDAKSLSLISNLVPSTFSKFDYVAHEDKAYQSDAPDKVGGMDKFLNQASGKSQKAYSASTTMPTGFHVQSKVELDNALKAEKTKAVSNMINLEGSSNTCRVRIGETIKVTFPKAMNVDALGEYLITNVTHIVNQDGHYSNTFTGVPAGLENIPVFNAVAQIALPEIATVKDNKDKENQGRVKVSFDWQKENKTTHWIRVQTPDAGVSDKVPGNRGFVCIPEVDDQVMIGYEHGDPSRPYVSGSLFHGKSGKGGDSSNKIKSITTRSGCTIKFDDDENDGSILITDPSGNMIALKGDKTIEITAPDKITLSAKEITLNGSDLISLNSDKMIESKSSDSISMEAVSKIVASADSEVTIESKGKLNATGMEVTVDGTAKTTIHGGATLDITGDAITTIKGMPLNLN